MNKNTPSFWDEKLQRIYSTRAFVTRIRSYLFLLDYLPYGRSFSLLDIGCAAGYGLGLLHRHLPQADLTGLDFSPVGIQIATREYPGIEFICDDVRTYELSQEYDFITIIRTLEHLENPFIILDKCLGCVRERVILSIPSARARCSEHVSKLTMHDFQDYEIEILSGTRRIKGHNFAVSRREIDGSPN